MFLLFAGYHYYPSGGWNDFVGQYDTIEEARQSYRSMDVNYEWYHIVSGNEIVEFG